MNLLKLITFLKIKFQFLINKHSRLLREWLETSQNRFSDIWKILFESMWKDLKDFEFDLPLQNGHETPDRKNCVVK